MAQSHRYCDHPATKSARAKCRRHREQFGEDYSEYGYGAGQGSYGFTCPRCGRRQAPRPFALCVACRLREQRTYRPTYTPPPASSTIVANANGGYKVSLGWKGQENTAADDAARSTICRRIVQLERKARSTTIEEAALLMAAALRFRTREGLVGQVL